MTARPRSVWVVSRSYVATGDLDITVFGSRRNAMRFLEAEGWVLQEPRYNLFYLDRVDHSFDEDANTATIDRYRVR